MLDSGNLQEHGTGFPPRSFLCNGTDDFSLPPTHQAQIYFLDAEATDFIQQYLHHSRMLHGPTAAPASPFTSQYFRSIAKHTADARQELKKWLYRRGIAFRRYVLLYQDAGSGQAVLLTWKMVIKYADRLFWANDVLLFDQSLNWGLFYEHRQFFTFGKDKPFDPEEEYGKMYALNDLRKKHPFLRFGY